MRKLAFAISLAALLALAACKAGTPGTMEKSMAHGVKQVTIGGKDWKNPVPDNEASVKEGAEHF